MIEEIPSATEGTSLSRIFKELAKLEKDFRCQETLYKIKTEELDKSTKTNKILKDHLEVAYSEIEELRKTIQGLQTKCNDLEVERKQEKEFYDNVVLKATNKINDMTTEHKTMLENRESEWIRCKNELEVAHNLFINELQQQHGEALIQHEQEQEKLSNHAKQLQSKLDYTLEDNLLLQDKLRKIHQGYLPLEAYKTQLKNITTSNEKLKSQCLHLKTEYQAVLNENTHLQKHNERLNQIVNNFKAQQSQITDEKEQQSILLAKVQNQLSEFTVEIDVLKAECENLNEENVRLHQEMDVKGDFCNIDTHRNIAEQNKILQELVKEMRKERMKCNGDQLQTNLDETEERIKRLEELIHELKKICLISAAISIAPILAIYSNYLNRVKSALIQYGASTTHIIMATGLSKSFMTASTFRDSR